ncbi:MAG: sigma-70 family RNA polymerase sigma factor, partial [Clostridia bacterium]|nr:sigma-70 family RNA polymerase sigma factor [Clostridia bacterium]
GSEALAYDLAQEVFLRFCRNFDRFAGEERLPMYLLRIARNLLIDEYRAARYELPLDAVDARLVEHDFADEAGLRADLARLIDRLPLSQRETVVLHYLCGLRLREIALLTGVGVATAKSRLRLGMAKLKEMLEQEGYQ